MSNVSYPISFAPQNLVQPILSGAQLSLFRVDLGRSSDAEFEQSVVNEVGSYGKQIGHLAEALEVVIRHFKLVDTGKVSQEDLKVLVRFLSDADDVRDLKRRHRAKSNQQAA